MYTKGFDVEQKSYGFKNLKKSGPSWGCPTNLPTPPPAYLPSYLPTYHPTYLPTYQSTYLPASREQCAQKQIKSLRCRGAEASLSSYPRKKLENKRKIRTPRRLDP